MTLVTRTLPEIRAMAMRAARGTGCTWGMAEDAGLAARVLESHGLPGVAVLTALFETPRACACFGLDAPVPLPACGLAAMVRLSDRVPRAASPGGQVAAPLLLAAPLLMQAARGGQTYVLAWTGASLICAPGGVVAQGDLAAPMASRVTLALADPPAHVTSPDWRARPVAAADWARLEALAARTYVPETEASRAAGAGPDAADTD